MITELSNVAAHVKKPETGLWASTFLSLCLYAFPAQADVQLGLLSCSIEDRFAPAFRNVTCVYTRANGVVETYSGFTGFSDVGNQQFDVFSTTAADPSGLQGDYDLKLTSTDKIPAGALAGPGPLYLLPRSPEGVPFGAAANNITGLAKLHLVFAGVTYPSKRVPSRKH